MPKKLAASVNHEHQLLVEDGAVQSPDQSVALLARTFFADDDIGVDSGIHTIIRGRADLVSTRLPDDINDPPITRAELVRAVDSFNPKKAPGQDGFTSDICCHAIHSEIELFLAILNRCLDLACFPKPWKEASVVVLRNHLSTNSMARLAQVQWAKYSFTPQRSTEDALYDLMQHVRGILHRKETALLVSLGLHWGPLFWNLLLDPLLDELDRLGAYVQAFADIVLVFSGHTALEIQLDAGAALLCVHNWVVVNKLRFSAEKSQAMVVTRKLKYDTPVVQMGGVDVPMVTELKILGVIVDSKLTFNTHVAYVCRKAASLYRKLSTMARVEWGLCAEIIRAIYVAVVEPTIMYGASAWARAVDKISVQRTLATVQRDFAQKIAKTHRTVSLNPAVLLSGLLPLDLRIWEAARLFECKRGRPIEELDLRELEEREAFFKASHHASEPDINYQCLDNMHPETVSEQQLPVHQIYTVGSKSADGVGAAYTYWRDGSEIRTKRMRLEPMCTVF
ncbi:uncharacterized protein LOC123723344 [Papilio machaon]|uniref:uncharacterized protein LOC123723344 n=1 Tax=Papilio machaon TaxID=76193 RepID=UPI001E664A3A|nr:uncharacterized protein LOC123723344 [Papilio machaon]